MASRRIRVRHKQPSEKRKPFFDKQSTEQGSFFSGVNPIQRKLSIGKASDPMEKEAETAAQKVTSQEVQKAEKEEEEPVQKADKKEEEKPVQKQEQKEEEPPVQKAEQKEEEKPVQKQEKEEVEKPVQAKLDPDIQPAGTLEEKAAHDSAQPSFESLLFHRKGKGFSLPEDIRGEMESKFGTTFKNVRIHTDSEAAAMCEEIHALAFTHGNDIYFNEGMYDPNGHSGKELLAHELAHVVQQNG